MKKIRPDSDGRKRIAELEKDIKKMQRDHAETFADFNRKQSLWERIKERLKRLFSKKDE